MATVEIESVALAHLVQQLGALLKSDATLRAIQSVNARTQQAFRQGTLTANAIEKATEAQNGNVTFDTLVVMFQDTSGHGRFRADGIAPTPAGGGFPIPAGGGILTIQGKTNIQQFQMIAETGATLDFAYGLFI